MRITGGSARGRKLAAPKSDLIRPTCDRVREALFNILGERIKDARVLDLFAGTGAVGAEALSRGAAFALFVDHSLDAGRLIEANLRTCFGQPSAAFVRLDLAHPWNPRLLLAKLEPEARFDLVFMDPPYQRQLADHTLRLIEQADILAAKALVVAEEHRRVDLPPAIGDLSLEDHRRYGESGLWFYQRHCDILT